jgi:hypothetical protein
VSCKRRIQARPKNVVKFIEDEGKTQQEKAEVGQKHADFCFKGPL